jgi:hypothetical protein
MFILENVLLKIRIEQVSLYAHRASSQVKKRAPEVASPRSKKEEGGDACISIAAGQLLSSILGRPPRLIKTR